MAQYPIKLLKDESGVPFVPLTSIKAVMGEEYIQSTFTAIEDSTGHFTISNDKLTDEDLLNKIIAISFPEDITPTTNSYLKLNNGTEYLIKDENGTGPLLIKDFTNVVCFIMRKLNSWQLVKTGAEATASSGGHTIVDNDGNILPQQSVLQFKGFGVSDNAGTGATVISTPSLINNLTTTESGTGPLDAYQGKVLNDKFNNYLPLSGGTLTGKLTFDSSIFKGTDQHILSFGSAGGIGASTIGDAIGAYGQTGIYLGTSGSHRILVSDSSVTASAGTYSLGTSSNKWNGVYSETFNNRKIEVLTTTTNFNDITATGIYGIRFDPSNSNSPAGGSWGTLIVESTSSTGTMYQIFIPDGSTNNIFKRGWVNSAWSSWNKFNAAYADGAGYASYSTTGGRLTAGTTTARQAGLRMYEIYNNGYPITYGNVLQMNGANGVSQLALQWHGTEMYYRSAPDTSTTFSSWARVWNSNNITPATSFVQSSQPTAARTGDIWFVV